MVGKGERLSGRPASKSTGFQCSLPIALAAHAVWLKQTVAHITEAFSGIKLQIQNLEGVPRADTFTVCLWETRSL